MKLTVILLVCFVTSSKGLKDMLFSYYDDTREEWHLKSLSRAVFSNELMDRLFKYGDFKTKVMEVAFQAWLQTVDDVMYFDKRSFWMQLHECLWDRKSFMDLNKCMKFSSKHSQKKSKFDEEILEKIKSDGEKNVKTKIRRLHDEMKVIEDIERILYSRNIHLESQTKLIRSRNVKMNLLREIQELVCCMPTLHDYDVSARCSGYERTRGKGTQTISAGIYIEFPGTFFGRVAIVIARRRYKTANIYMCTEASTERLVLLGYDKTMIPNKNKTHRLLGYETVLKNPYNISNEAIIFSHDQAVLKDSTRRTTMALKGRIKQNVDIKIERQLQVLQSTKHELVTTSSFFLENMKLIKLCIELCSSMLWESHSNLRIITADTEKIKDGKSIKKQCIVFYCLSKGYIPLGEKPFQKYLIFETDVREGYFVMGPRNAPTTHMKGDLDRFNEPLCMGSNIGEETRDETGTLGLFVNLPNKSKGFITCCHVLFDCIHRNEFRYLSWYKDHTYKVVQPGNSAFCDRPDRECGKVEKACFLPNRTPSVDVALVEITDRKPTNGHFAIRNKVQVKELGYKTDAYPNYANGKVRRGIRETDLDLPVIKSGSTTGLTRSYFK